MVDRTEFQWQGAKVDSANQGGGILGMQQLHKGQAREAEEWRDYFGAMGGRARTAF